MPMGSWAYAKGFVKGLCEEWLCSFAYKECPWGSWTYAKGFVKELCDPLVGKLEIFFATLWSKHISVFHQRWGNGGSFD